MSFMVTGSIPAFEQPSEPVAAPRIEVAELQAGSLVAATLEATPTADFENFVAAVLPKVLRLATSLGASRPDAEDIAAEALARAFASWGRVQGLDYRDGWVLRTTTNIVYDRARRRSARPEGSERGLAVDCFEQSVVDRSQLVDALRRLSTRQRQALVLHHLADFRIDEVAEAMGVSPNSVKKFLARGMSRLRTQLPGRGEEDTVA